MADHRLKYSLLIQSSNSFKHCRLINWSALFVDAISCFHNFISSLHDEILATSATGVYIYNVYIYMQNDFPLCRSLRAGWIIATIDHWSRRERNKLDKSDRLRIKCNIQDWLLLSSEIERCSYGPSPLQDQASRTHTKKISYSNWKVYKHTLTRNRLRNPS